MKNGQRSTALEIIGDWQDSPKLLLTAALFSGCVWSDPWLAVPVAVGLLVGLNTKPTGEY
jgi:hypothetical protein